MKAIFHAAIAVLLLATTRPALACIGIKTAVAHTGAKSAAAPADPEAVYDVGGVRQHFDALLPLTDYRSNTQSTYSCVDSRGEAGELGTLGGDAGELAGAIYTYLKVQGVTGDITSAVRDIFNDFMAQVASPERPFYYHTSDEKLHKVFKSVNEDGELDPKVTVFPEIMPTNPEVRELWLSKLTNGSYQGCGHMRLMIDQFADYGLDSPDVPRALVKAFFQYWWPTPLGSSERAKVKFAVVQGPLDGKAVAIVDTAGGCPGLSPAAVPSHSGSQVFVYHGKAVEELRALTLAPFFAEYAADQGKPLDKARFFNDLKSLQAQQLRATLTYLAPANSVPLFSVTVTSLDSGNALGAAANAGNAAVARAAPNVAHSNAAARSSAFVQQRRP